VIYKFLHLLKAALFFSFSITIPFLSLSAYGQNSRILKMIPGNASMVFTINGNSINKKMDFNKVQNHNAFKFLDSIARFQLKENYNTISRLYKNPSDLGIDLTSNIYSFYRKSDNSANYFGGIFIPLSDMVKFETFLFESGLAAPRDKIIKKGRYSYISEEGFLFAWTEKFCMIVSKPFFYKGSDKELSTQLINKIIHQKTKHSILNNQDFVLSQKNNFDLAYWINYQSFFNQSLIRTFRTENVAEDNKDFFTGNYVHSYVNFRNGNITYDSKFFIIDRLSKKNKVKTTTPKKANPELFKYFHKDSILGLICFSIDLRETQITVNENMRKSKENFKSELMAKLFGDEFEKDDTLITKNRELNDLYFKYHSTDTIPFIYTPQIEIEVVPVSDSIKPEVTKNETINSSYSYLDYDFLEGLIKNKNNEIKKREIELADNKLKDLGYTEKDIWDLFEGDIMIGLTDFKYKETKYTVFESDDLQEAPKLTEKTKKEIFPGFMMAATTYKTEIVKRVLASLEKEGLITAKDHYYKMPTAHSEYFIMLSDKILIVSNDENLIKNKTTGYASNEKIPAEAQEVLLSNSFSMYLNMERMAGKLPKDTSYTLYQNIFPGSIKELSIQDNFLPAKASYSERLLTMVNKTNNTLYEVFRIINQAYILSVNR
jgi:hypothetical protein